MLSLWRLAARAVSPFGRRSSTSVYGGLVSMSGTTLPREQLRVVDLAVPTEFLISQPPVHPWDTRFSVYLGPRVAIEHYDDLDNPDQSLAATYYGLLGGLHLTAGFFHLFAEATLTHVPQNQYQGQTYGDRWTVMPAIGMVFHVGRAYSWK